MLFRGKGYTRRIRDIYSDGGRLYGYVHHEGGRWHVIQASKTGPEDLEYWRALDY